MDAKYLKEKVGDVLARGCAAAAIARPKDSVAFVGEWLLNYVESQETLKRIEVEVQGRNAHQQEAKIAHDEAAREADAARRALDSAVAGLDQLVEDPMLDLDMLFKKVLDTVYANTRVSAAYIATVQEPDVPVPEEGEEPPAEGEAEEEDEWDKPVPSEGDEGAEAAPAEEPQEEGEPTEGDEPAEEKALEFFYDGQKLVYEYSTQEFLLGKNLDRKECINTFSLLPSKPSEEEEAADDEEEGAVPKVPTQEEVVIANVMRTAYPVHFWRGFPRVGGFVAVPLKKASGEILAVLCVDRLKTIEGGSGLPVLDEDRDFISRICGAFTAVLEKKDVLRASNTEEKAGDLLAPIELEELEDIEGESELEKNLRKKKAEYDVVHKRFIDLDLSALAEIKSYPKCPEATLGIVKATFLLLGDEDVEKKTWGKIRTGIIPAKIVDAVNNFDVMGVRNKKKWKVVKNLLPSNADAVAKESLASSALFNWIQHAGMCNLAAHKVAVVRAQEAAAAEAAAAAAAAEEAAAADAAAA